MIRQTLAATAAALLSLPAWAHVSYNGRDFGTLTGLNEASVTIANQAVAGNFGWADAADADWGDSHKARWFKFTLTNEALVTFSVAAKADATATSLGGFVPAFSLYRGLAPITIDAQGTSNAPYDTAAPTLAWRDTLGFATEGAWNALGDFKIGNDAGVLGELTHIGHAADGIGTLGDGLADGLTRATFRLSAGTYSLVVGGNVYGAQQAGAPGNTGNFGISASLSVSPISAVPEPGSFALAAIGLALLGWRQAGKR